MRRVIIDTDTAGDDTTAILMALHHFKVEGITIASGNVEFNQQVENALVTVETFGPQEKVPVLKGHESPMISLPLKKHLTVEEIQGGNGMGDAVFPKPNQVAEDEHAVDFMIRTIKENPGEIEIIALAPLTNIAMAIKRDPTILTDIKHIWIMGGINNALGNVAAVAEYNFYVDPEAARIVLHSGVPQTLVTWDASLDYGVIYDDDIAIIEALDTKGSKFFLDVNLFVKAFEFAKRGVDGITCTDSLLAAVAADESIVLKATDYYVDIETGGNLTRGFNLVDRENELGQAPNIRIIENIDSDKFKAMLGDMLADINN